MCQCANDQYTKWTEPNCKNDNFHRHNHDHQHHNEDHQHEHDDEAEPDSLQQFQHKVCLQQAPLCCCGPGCTILSLDYCCCSCCCCCWCWWWWWWCWKPVRTETNTLALLSHEVSVTILQKIILECLWNEKMRSLSSCLVTWKCESHLHVVAAFRLICVCPTDQVTTVLLLILL